METITLYNVEGFARKSGTDGLGSQWIEFETDCFAEQEAGTCSICEAEIESGWMCLDGAEEVCAEHIVIDESGFDRKGA